MKIKNAPLGVIVASFLCVACAEAPQQEADLQAPKLYRTGSNIPVKDYGAEKIDVASPDVINPVNRPMANVLGKKPGQ